MDLVCDALKRAVHHWHHYHSCAIKRQKNDMISLKLTIPFTTLVMYALAIIEGALEISSYLIWKEERDESNVLLSGLFMYSSLFRLSISYSKLSWDCTVNINFHFDHMGGVWHWGHQHTRTLSQLLCFVLFFFLAKVQSVKISQFVHGGANINTYHTKQLLFANRQSEVMSHHSVCIFSLAAVSWGTGPTDGRQHRCLQRECIQICLVLLRAAGQCYWFTFFHFTLRWVFDWHFICKNCYGR